MMHFRMFEKRRSVEHFGTVRQRMSISGIVPQQRHSYALRWVFSCATCQEQDSNGSQKAGFMFGMPETFATLVAKYERRRTLRIKY